MDTKIEKIPLPKRHELSEDEKQFAKGFKCAAIEKEADVMRTFRVMLQYVQPNEVMLAFNGGKDCTIVLHLLNKFYRQKPLCHYVLPVLYVRQPNSFEEIDCFVARCKKQYDLDLTICECDDIKAALEIICTEMPDIRAVVMGSRKSDPSCKVAAEFQHTDPGWPELIRVNPLLEWSYSDVWKYIFFNDLPYCSLYRKGYTSLGTKNDTVPNPFVRVILPDKILYDHAYTLEDEEHERAGRS